MHPQPHARSRYPFPWLVALACLLLPALSQAFCGFYAGKADANLFNEASQVVLVRDGPRTVISMLNDYAGPLNEFALIVPTPTVLTQGQVRVADKATFERLDAFSSPRLAEYHDSNPCQLQFDWGNRYWGHLREAQLAMSSPPAPAAAANMAKRSKALGVTVEAQYTLEEYDIVSLSAKQSDGLEIWLQENGYKVPKGASAALKPYINQGMKFFVAKVNLKEQSRLGFSTLRPLQFAFESEKFMLPMRLGMLNAPADKPQDLIVYVLTKEGRVESSNYRTVKLPTNENLPPQIKPKFGDFYKALYDSAAKREDYRVVFTEYFWDMSWCDPCAADPLTATELSKAGVFWVGGDASPHFRAKRAANIAANDVGGAQPVLLTRLHVRYTANTFPEDLMFTQTKDRQNWQTRYVIQNPYVSAISACAEQMAANDCEMMCDSRVAQVELIKNEKKGHGWRVSEEYANMSSDKLQLSCTRSCAQSKFKALDTAARYYGQELPARLEREKYTLAKLTGWSMPEIDRLVLGTQTDPLQATPPKKRADAAGELLRPTTTHARG